MAIATSQTKAITKSADATLDRELSKVGITTLFVAAGLVGIWGVACFVSGLAQVGGPLSLVRQWIAAITGV